MAEKCECNEEDKKIKRAKPAKRLGGVNEVDYEVHAEGIQVRARIVSHDEPTTQVAAQASVLVENALKQEWKKKKIRKEVQ
jgi:hypothetical protein